MLNFEQQEWYNEDDARRIPISAHHLNRIEEAVAHSVKGVNEMFNYWWRKSNIVDVTGTDYTAYDNSYYLCDSETQTIKYYYSDSFSYKIDKLTGEIYLELDNPDSIDLSYATMTSNSELRYIFRNKYFIPETTSGKEICKLWDTGYAYRKENIDMEHPYGVVFSSTSVYEAYPIYGAWTYVNSDKIDAHSNGWDSSEEAMYEFLGVPFENSRESLKVMHGKYCGDGVSGRLITTPRKPKCIWWEPANSSQAIVTELFANATSSSFASYIKLTDNGFFLTSYNVNSRGQLYDYIIFY